MAVRNIDQSACKYGTSDNKQYQSTTSNSTFMQLVEKMKLRDRISRNATAEGHC